MQSHNSLQQKWYVKLREFFWPMLEPPLPVNANGIQADEEFVIENENLDLAFDLIQKHAENEEARRKEIESKATFYLSSISIAASLVVGTSAILIDGKMISWPIIATAFLAFILTLYTCASVWYSVKALERKSYSILGYNDLNKPGNKNQYKSHLIKAIRTKTVNNYLPINDKVDNLTLAQLFYKRAIVLISLYALLLLAFAVYSYASNKDKKNNMEPKATVLKATALKSPSKIIKMQTMIKKDSVTQTIKK